MDVLPEGVRAGNEKLLEISPEAGSKLVELMAREQKGDFLRVKITGGGCNGLVYNMEFVAAAKRGDILVSAFGAAVLVDSRTALYLKGTKFEYSSKLVGGGFEFTNPNATANCSCGQSFSI